MQKIGARIIKTGIAVAITMFVCNSLKLEPALFGAVSAVINMQPSLYFSLKTALDQTKIHLVGVLAGMILGYLFGGNPITMGIVAMFIIYTYIKLGLQSGILMGIVAAIFVLGASQDQFLTNALNRSAVIFIGLAVSSIVNFTLWPPRYEKKLIEKIREADILAVNYFSHAVEDFATLDRQEIHPHDEAKNHLYSAISEARKLMDYIHDENKFRYNMQKIIDYIDGVAEKADRIYEIIPTRIERRAKYGNQPVSEEYHLILELLTDGLKTVARVNKDIRLIVCDNIIVDRQKIHEHYWTRLTNNIEQWQYHLSSSYYVHGLIDVAVVASEIRWVTREGKKIINGLLEDKDSR